MARKTVKKTRKRAVKKQPAKPSPKQAELEEETAKDKSLLDEQLERIEKGEPLLPPQNEPEEEQPNEETPQEPEQNNGADSNSDNNDVPDSNDDNNIGSDSNSNVQANTPTGSTIDIFADLAKPTEQDTKQKSRIETAMDDMVADDYDEVDNGEEDSEEIKKTSAKASAGIWVTVIDALAMLGCCFLAKDLSDEAQRKFTLIPEKKTAIRQALYQVFMLRKKKTNPHIALASAIAGSYVPLMIIAVLQGRKESRRRQEEAMMQEQAMNNPEPIEVPYTPEPTPYVSEVLTNTPDPQKEKDNSDIAENFGGAGVRRRGAKKKAKKKGRGRHKRNCSYHRDKDTCNCR